MKKFYIFVFSFVFLVMITTIMLIGFSFNKNLPRGIFFFPTPTPANNNFVNNNAGTNKQSNPVIKGVSPLDQSQNVSLNTEVVITFSKNVFEKDFSFWIAPDVPYSKTLNENTLTITPNSPLSSDTIYSFGLKFPDGNYSNTYTFSTVGTGIVNNSNYDNYSQTTSSFEKQNNPDIFLSNQMPYSTDTFYANSAYSDTQSHYYFVVFMLGSDNNKSKLDFINWVKTFGLTDNQVAKLDIRYQENKINEPD
jgi:hypothetical protein